MLRDHWHTRLLDSFCVRAPSWLCQQIDYLEDEALKKRNRAEAILDSVLDSLSNLSDGTHIERSAKGGLETASTLLTEAEENLKSRTSDVWHSAFLVSPSITFF